jgi:rhodanese-related sulfurtransferase
MSHSPEFLAIVNDAKSRVQETDLHGADDIMRQNPGALLIDIREDHEWEKEHVNGAIHIGKGVIERDITKIVPDKSTSLLLYCGGGFRSALAADNLQKMGYTNLWSIDGGYRAYKDAGREMESGT